MFLTTVKHPFIGFLSGNRHIKQSQRAPAILPTPSVDITFAQIEEMSSPWAKFSIDQHGEQLFYDRNAANKTHLNAFDVEVLSYMISNWILVFVNQIIIIMFIYKFLALVLLASTNEQCKPTEPKQLLTFPGLLWLFHSIFFPHYPFRFTTQPYLSSTSRASHLDG